MMGSCLGLYNSAASRRDGRPVPLNSQTEALVSMRAAANDYPLYWVDRSFLETVLRTDPPDRFTLSELAWPFPAIIFLLPKNTLRHETEGDCSWLMIGHVGGLHKCPLSGHQIQVENNTITAITAPCERANPSTYTFGIPNDSGLEPFQPLPDFGGGKVENFLLEDPSSSSAQMTAGDATLCQVALQLGLRLILALTARPDLMQPMVPGKIVNVRGRRSEFCAPRWIGRGHEIKVAGGADVRNKLSWQRGRFDYRSPENRAQGKLEWIEPMLVESP